MFGSCGSGTALVSQSIWANSSSRPARTSPASSGSGWERKKHHGVAAPHSSPMKIIGVNGLSSVIMAAIAMLAAVELRRQPLAGRPVADLIMVVGADHQPPGRRAEGVDRVPVAAAGKLDLVPSWKNPASKTLPRASSESKSA